VSVDKTPGWQERADDLARAMRLDVEIARLSRPGRTNAELAELLPPDLRQVFWRRELDSYFAAELGTEAGRDA
jgi:hypothetical protein